jgi:hypothetical protein
MNVTRLLARRRVALGFALGAVALFLARPTRGSLIAGAPIAMAGEGLRVWAAGHLEKSREVTVSGPYRWTRHPLYVGSTLLGIGLAVVSNSLLVGAVVVAYLALTLTAAARFEEEHLASKFGGSYEQYRKGAAPSSARRFSFERARRNGEHRTMVGVAIVFAVLIVLASRR